MTPIKFKEANMVLKRPSDMTEDECGDLHVHRLPDSFISCWQFSLIERISALLFGRIWFYSFGSAHPPVAIICKRRIFHKKIKEKRK